MAVIDDNTARLLEILQRCFNPLEDGWIWYAFYVDDRAGGVVSQIEGDYGDPELTADSLAKIAAEVRPDRVFLALCRREGRPTEDDRRLWRHLRQQIDPAMLRDMVVFNGERTWSMRAEDAAARPLAG
jgi:hypothetical protein